MKRFILIIISIVFVSAAAIAQVSVQAHLDSVSIFVGSQTNLTVTVKGAREGSNIVFPSFKDEQEMTPE